MPVEMDDETDRLRARVVELEAALADARARISGPMASPRTPPSAADVLFSAVEMTRMPMIVTDPHQYDHPIIFANRAFQQLCGYSSEELIGRNCRFLQGENTSPEDIAQIRTAIAERRDLAIDIVNYHRDGHSFVNELYISPVFDKDDQLLYYFGSQVDLTAYRDESLRLKQNEERYRSLFGAIDAGFAILEMKFDDAGHAIDYKFIETNPAFLRQTGLKDAEGRWVSEVIPDLEPWWFETYGNVAKTRQGVRFENEAAPLDRFFDVHAYPTGKPADNRVAVLFNDVTLRKRIEYDLKALNETLEQQVQERTDALMLSEEARRQSAKLEAIGQLTGGVAHDFNNLLTIISSAADFLQRDGLDDQKRRRYAGAISDTAARAAKLTGQLLAFARRQPLKAEVFDVGERVARNVDLIRSLVGAGIEIDTEGCAHGACTVEADIAQFETAIVNLAVNARDAMDGHGRLRITLDEVSSIPPLRHHGPRAGRFIAVGIVDEGAGIDAEVIDRVFEPFFTTKEVGKGTGLGLSQVFGFAKQSGGDISVSSSPRGTTFTLYLPARESSSDGETIVARADTATVSDACILVVEDNPEVGQFSTEVLHDLGYRTRWVMNADAALEALADRGSAYDLVFSDVMMPGRNGVELAWDIRARYPDLPVILTSGYSSALAEEGAHGFELIRKPYSIETIAQVFARELAR